MSTASKATLLASIIGTVAIVSYVHVSQVQDREKLHRGIVRDQERQQAAKTENLYRLQQQQELTKIYREREAGESKQ